MKKLENMQQDENYNKEYDLLQLASAAVTIGGATIGTMGKGLSFLNQGRSEKILRNAQQKYKESFESLERSAQAAQAAIQNVVLIKKDLMGKDMKLFLKAYRRLNPRIYFSPSAGLNELERFVPQRQEYRQLRLSARVYDRYDAARLGDRAGDVALVMVQDGTVRDIFLHVAKIHKARRHHDRDLEIQTRDELKLQMIPVLARFSTVALEFAVDGMTDMISSFKQVGEAKRVAAELRQQTETLKLNDTRVQAIGRYADIHLDLLQHYISC